MASRLALDLGLHIGTAAHVAEGKMTPEVARARQVAFWGTYIIDELWCFYLGRPLRNSLGEMLTAPPQVMRQGMSQPFWKPYRHPENAARSGQLELIPDCAPTVFVKHLATLCHEISSLALILYGSERASNDELMESAEKTFHALQRWKLTLPRELQFDSSNVQTVPPPHILLLHVQYHAFIIILHRPFVSKHRNQPYPPRGRGPFHARSMCLESATEIAKIMKIYESRYSLAIAATPVVHTTFTAALILVYATISETDRDRHAERSEHLATCCRTLSELGHHFDNATRALDTLLAIKRHWQGIVVVGNARKRSSSSCMKRKSASSRKKLRPSGNQRSPNSLGQSVLERASGSNPQVSADSMSSADSASVDANNVDIADWVSGFGDIPMLTS
ncbi:hypothetical protein V1505DRAFT_359151 [Lipomyces doorenjongii]